MQRKILGQSYKAVSCQKFPAEACRICDARSNKQVCGYLVGDPKTAGCQESNGVRIYWNKVQHREKKKI